MTSVRSAVALVATALVGCLVVFGSQAAFGSPSDLKFVVIHTNDAPPNGVLFRTSPHTADADRRYGHGVNLADRVQLRCYAFGDVVGNFNSKLWYQVLNVSRPRVNGSANGGYLNAHYINDHKGANIIDPGVPACSATPTSATATPTNTTQTSTTQTSTAPTQASATPTSVPAPSGAAIPTGRVDGIDVGVAVGAWHRVGSCQLRTYRSPALGSITVAALGSVLHVVRNGMQTGWLSAGGAEGKLGCPLTAEQHSVVVDKHELNVQQFQHGQLYWTNGMGQAVPVSTAVISALRWGWNCMVLGCTYRASVVGDVANYYSYCLAFVYDAYRLGAGIAPVGGPTGQSATAAQWWSASAAASKVVGTILAPPGTLVVWSSPGGVGGGHIALSIGAGFAISSWDGYNPATGIHVLQISTLAPRNYLGYVLAGVA